jgi:hypothetical protein
MSSLREIHLSNKLYLFVWVQNNAMLRRMMTVKVF